MTSTFISKPTQTISGRVWVPGDKSISHRALILGALAEGDTEIIGFLPGEDCLATLTALETMGIEIDRPDKSTVHVKGRGLKGLAPPSIALDTGNSGTAMRLLAGLLCGQDFDTTLTGDASLRQRPMERVAEPLRSMGAKISTDNGNPPLTIHGGQQLHGINYVMPVASAQVKSAILLAGLYANGETSISELAITRDHTERMLREFGWPLVRKKNRLKLSSGGSLQGTVVEVPGDLSSAAFFLLAACLSSRGELTIENVGLNPTRTGILQILQLMGADLEIQEKSIRGGEPVGRILARPSRLRGAVIPSELVPLAIDEFPLVFIAAAFAEGQTVISGVEELRYKESDRIQVMVDGLKRLGVDAEERADGARIKGSRLTGGEVGSAGDHRVAMAFAVGGLAADAPVHILDADNVATSFPDFIGRARSIGLDISSEEPDGG